MTTTQTVTLIYGAVLHLAAVTALTVLMATGHLDWATGGALLAGLLGFGAGVPVSLATGSTPATVPPAPAIPAAAA